MHTQRTRRRIAQEERLTPYDELEARSTMSRLQLAVDDGEHTDAAAIQLNREGFFRSGGGRGAAERVVQNRRAFTGIRARAGGDAGNVRADGPERRQLPRAIPNHRIRCRETMLASSESSTKSA
jgi:hypothetical protein